MHNMEIVPCDRKLSKLCAAASRRHTRAVESMNCPLERSPAGAGATIAPFKTTGSVVGRDAADGSKRGAGA